MFLEDLKSGIRTRNVEEMDAIAKNFAACCPLSCFLALHGDLGSGKTAFVKGLGRAWNIDDVKSPSFNIVDFHLGQRRLAHVDAYRLDKANLDYFGLEDFLIPPFCLAVEWPEKLEGLIDFDFQLYFSIVGACHQIQWKPNVGRN